MGRQHNLVGKEAPEVSLPNYDGETYTLKPGSDGLPIALFFYPKSGKRSFVFRLLVGLTLSA